MEPVGSLPHSQVLATCPYPVPARSSPYPHIPILENPSYFYPPFHSWVSQEVSFPRVSPPTPCICLSSVSYALHTPPISFFSILSTKQYWVRSTHRSLSSSLCSFLHSLVISSLLGPNILLSTLFSETFGLRSSLNTIMKYEGKKLCMGIDKICSKLCQSNGLFLWVRLRDLWQSQNYWKTDIPVKFCMRR